MKNLKYLSLIILSILFACNDSFIELAPISEGNAENFYQTPQDFELAVVAIYDNLQSPSQYGSDDSRYGGGFYSLMEVRADDVSDGDASSGVGEEIYEIDNFQDNTLSSVIEGSWNSIFKTIFDANVVITRIENIEIDAASKNQYIAEAKFLRALSYFNAVRLWGELPVIETEITPQEAQALSRQPVSNVYALIEEDLQFASDNLPAALGGRATSSAAKALLGKVYLTEEKWSDANNALQGVSGQLLDNIDDVFDINNDLNDEFVFAVQFMAGSDGEDHGSFGTPEFSTLLLAEYEAGDARLSLIKFPETENNGRNFAVIRYSDVLLMQAEALNEIDYVADGDALAKLNQVRKRAGATEYLPTDLTTQSEFRDAVMKERRLELAWEDSRWFDLLRTGNAITALGQEGITVKQYQLLYPVPQNEINVYNNPSQFPQNEGY